MTPNPDNQPFRHYTLKHKIVAWISQNLFDNISYTVRHGLLTGMKRRGGLGWIPEFLAPNTETAEHLFWKRLPLKGQNVYDVGAFHGLVAMYLASRAQQVICYEPNSENMARLDENMRLNDIHNVRVRPFGVGSRIQAATLVSSSLMPGGASLDEHVAASIQRQDASARTEEIRITTLDQDIEENGLPAPDLIKIDIEGWEIEALRGAQGTLTRHRPALFLEMHGETMAEKRRKVGEIVAFLNEIGYHDIRHVESSLAVTAENCHLAAQGHLYCVASPK